MVIAEIALRLFFPQYSYGYPRDLFLADPDIGYRYKPNFDGGYVTKQEFSTRVWTNSQGFRDRERNLEKPPDTFRILSIGDSFTWGAYGVEADETFSLMLEQSLNQKSSGPSFEVLNMGVFGYGTDNEIRLYQKIGTDYRPDCVITNFFIGNDFYDNMKWGEVSIDDGDLVSTRFVDLKPFSIKYARAFMLKHSYLATLVERSLFTIPSIQKLVDKYTHGQETQHIYGGELFEALIGKGDSPTWDHMLTATSSLLQAFNQEAQRHQTCFVLVVIPAVYQVHDDLRAQLVSQYGTDFASIAKTQSALQALGEREGFPVIDLLPGFREAYHQGQRLYWQFNPHFNHAGNRLTSEIMMQYLTTCDFPICRVIADATDPTKSKGR